MGNLANAPRWITLNLPCCLFPSSQSTKGNHNHLLFCTLIWSKQSSKVCIHSSRTRSAASECNTQVPQGSCMNLYNQLQIDLHTLRSANFFLVFFLTTYFTELSELSKLERNQVIPQSQYTNYIDDIYEGVFAGWHLKKRVPQPRVNSSQARGYRKWHWDQNSFNSTQVHPSGITVPKFKYLHLVSSDVIEINKLLWTNGLYSMYIQSRCSHLW